MSKDSDPKPMKKTSAVPLRKETVRVTLKADPKDSKAPAKPASPPAAKPPAPPAPTASAPKPPAPAPTIPLKTSAAPTAQPPAPAPTVQLQTGASTTNVPTPAPTVKLNTPGTVPLAGAPVDTGAASQPLPKATVQMQQTQPMGSPATPSQAATIRTADDEDTSNKGEGAAAALSVVALIAALIVLGVQLATANIWVDGEWAKLFE